eukprot:294030-Chlamydomonas_euryale.AAC.3
MHAMKSVSEVPPSESDSSRVSFELRPAASQGCHRWACMHGPTQRVGSRKQSSKQIPVLNPTQWGARQRHTTRTKAATHNEEQGSDTQRRARQRHTMRTKAATHNEDQGSDTQWGARQRHTTRSKPATHNAYLTPRQRPPTRAHPGIQLW